MNNLQELRRKAGLTQTQLAEMLGVKFAGTISRYERGERLLDSESITKLCKILECTADELLGLEHEKEVLERVARKYSDLIKDYDKE